MRITSIVIYCLVAVSLAAHAENVFIKPYHSFKASFVQKTTQVGTPSAQQKVLRGKVYFKAPHYFKWIIGKLPDRKQYLMNQQHQLYAVDSSLEQVIIYDLSQQPSMTLPFILLQGNSQKISRFFKVKLLSHSQHNMKYQLTPVQADSPAKRILLSLSAGRIKMIKVYDKQGNMVDISFHHATYNKTISNQIFKYHTPKHYDVIHT